MAVTRPSVWQTGEHRHCKRNAIKQEKRETNLSFSKKSLGKKELPGSTKPSTRQTKNVTEMYGGEKN